MHDRKLQVSQSQQRIRVAGEARVRAAARRFLLSLWLLAALLAAQLGGAWAAPIAGTVLSNTATVSYDIPSTGQTVSNAPSNTVTAVVAQVAAFTLTSSQTRTVPANTPVVFTHTLTNTGNGPDRFAISVQNPAPGCAGCTYTFSSTLLAPDTSPQDGVPDSAGAATLTTPVLAAGQSYTFVLTAQVPNGLSGGQFAQAQVSAAGDAATAATGGYAAAGTQSNTDQATISAGALISTTKTFSVISGPSPGAANILVTITYTNNSGVAASNVRIQDWIGMSNPVGAPALDTTGLRYVAGSARWSGCNAGTGALTDAAEAAGTFESVCTAVAPQRINYKFTANATPGTGMVDALIESVAANASGQFTFNVQVTGGLAAGSSQTTNAARVSYCDAGTCGGGTNQNTDTNQALYVVAPISGIDLTLAKTVTSPASGRFSINNPGEYLLQVNNIGPTASSGTITVTDSLPGGLEVTSISASAWTCTQGGAFTAGNNTGGGVSITCSTTSIVAGASGTAGQAPPIRIAVTPRIVAGVLTIPGSGSANLINTATVSGGGEPAGNAGNNTGSVSTLITMGASIQGRVWRDIPTSTGVLPNRLYDAGIDQPLSGWKVEVLDTSTLQVIKTAYTQGSSAGADFGKYNVTDLTPGTYFLQFRDPSNSIIAGTAVCGGSAAAADPMGNATNSSGSFNPANCQMPTGGSTSGTPSQLDQSGRYLRITLQGGETIIDQNLPLDPSGIVYDARTGAAVSGATVRLTALTTARTPLATFSASTDLVGGAGADTYVTGADGFYQFLLTFSGQTKCTLAGGCILELSVTPPSGYQPFTVSTTLYPPQASTGNCTAFATNCLDATGGLGFLDASGAAITVPPIPTTSKYWMRFLVDNNSRQILNNHFPLVSTSTAVNNLLVQKKANRNEAEIGDFVDYTVTVLNGTSNPASPVTVTDRLPAGFKYVAGTTRIATGSSASNGVPAPDPVGGAGPVLAFNAGSLAAGASVTLTYRVQLSINAPQGDGKNLASAAAPGLSSNTATAIVKVRGGVFDNKGYIVGTVFMDCNRDRVQGEREPGIPGVRLFMEDGTMVVTDAEGKYSLYGVSPRTHVMKVDEITLPRGAELIALNNRNAGDPSSRFVDVKMGEMARADFAEGSCAPEVFAEVKARRAKGETGQAELNRAFGAAFGGSVTPAATVSQGAPTSGVVVGPQATAPSLGTSLTPLNNGTASAVQTQGGALPGGVIPPGLTSAAMAAAAASSGAQVSAPAAPGAPALPGVPHVTAPGNGPVPQPDATRDPGTQAPKIAIYQPLNAQGGASSVNSSNSNLPGRSGDLTSAQLPDVATAPIIARKLEDMLPEMDNRFEVLDLKDGDTLPLAQVNLRIKGAFGNTFTLTVNGEPVALSRVGQRSTLQSKGVQAWEYIGVPLRKGPNAVVARQVDQFGNTRGEVKLNLIAPGELAKLVIDAPDSATADGSTPILVKVRLTDDNGVQVSARTAVTLTTSLGRWDVADLNPSEPGTQVFITGGAATFKLVPSADAGDANIGVVGGNFKAQKKIAFLPYLRPLTGAGIIEGAFSLNSLSLKNMVAAQQRDGFEQQIQRFHYESGDGKRSSEGRAAMFLKGKIKGEYLLTLAYDSDKDLKERVFRDINPDEFYPIYGDASVRGFDAQTSGRFYVRVDKGRNFVLYGDFNTNTQMPNRQLSQFSRTLTGAKVHLEDSRYQVNGFASRDTFRQVVLEFNANGTSGPFDLALPSGAVINSEKVEVLTRDRYQPAVILATSIKGRFSDYEIEPYAGRLLFKAPVASLDANLNPQTIRVTYEMDQGGAPFWVAGIDGQYKLTDNFEVGGMYVKDQNPSGEFSMAGANATYKISEKTVVMAEVARTDRQAPAVSAGTSLTGANSNVIGAGNAARAEVRHSDGNIDARAYWGRSDATFDNPSSSLNRGREEAGGRVTYKLAPSTSVSVDALHTGDVTSGAKRDALQLRADHSFSNGIKVEVGVRRVQEEMPSAVDPVTGAASAGAQVVSTGYTSVRARVTAPVPGLPQASMFGEVEQSVQGDERRIVAAGADYKFSEVGRVYARLENNRGVASAGGITTEQKNNVAAIGIDTSLTKDTKAFSEYRARDTIDGATSEAAVGLRNNWQIADGLRISTSYERVQPFTRLTSSTNSAVVSNAANAVTGAIEYTASPLWKGSARIEVRNGDASDGILSTFGVAYKLSREWSLLTRSTWMHTNVKGATPGVQDRLRFQIGAAYRDVDTNRWNMVTRYEHREEKDTTTEPILKRAVDLASLHFNYQPERSLILTGRFATKYVNEESSGILSRSTGTLVSGRATWDISSRWDIGVTGSLHTDGGLSNRKFGLGLEVGYLIQENLWISGGYNFFGFKDKDLAGADYTDRGIYVRMRYKFDETLFDPKRDARLRGLPEEKAP
jgi:uncharacterized repeat protein (TIGR01451 family)